MRQSHCPVPLIGIEPYCLCDILRNVLSFFIELAEKICGIGFSASTAFLEVAEGFLHILRRCFFIGEDEFGKLIAGKGVSRMPPYQSILCSWLIILVGTHTIQKHPAQSGIGAYRHGSVPPRQQNRERLP